MKKYYILIFGLLFFSTIKAQIVSIPDANFKTALVSANETTLQYARDEQSNVITIDTNHDGEIQESEAATVYYLNVENFNISDLTGINSFVNLISLQCNSNNLTSLDVSNLSNLIYLNSSNNFFLSNLNISGITSLQHLEIMYNSLTTLDITNSTNLIYLDLSSNQISSLNVNNLVNLTSLNCSENLISSLDISNLTELYSLGCSYNSLTNLNLNNLVNLGVLSCSNNQLTSLDLSNNNNLTNLNYSNNQIATIDINHLTNLTSLDCSQNQISTLNISNLINLTVLNYSYNQITNLDLSNFKFLQSLSCRENNLTELNLQDLKLITSLDCSSNQLTQLNLSNLAFLNGLNCSHNNILTLDTRTCPLLTNIYCNNNLMTSMMTNSIYHISFDSYHFIGNHFSSFCCNAIDISNVHSVVPTNCVITSDCSLPSLSPFDSNFKQKIITPVQNQEENYIVRNYINKGFNLDINNDGEIQQFEANQVYYLNISGSTTNLNPITSITGINFFPNLISLNCSYNQIPSSEINNLSNISNLNCIHNQITSLDTSTMTNLTELYAQENLINSITFGTQSNLKKINLRDNQIASLPLNSINAIEELNIASNQISGTIDFSNNTNLTTLICDNNQISNLVFSPNSPLITLNCSFNQLTTIDTNTITQISGLDCNNNQITTLDIVPLTQLTYFNVGNNLLTTIDVSNATSLVILSCYHNLLTNLNVSNLINLERLYCDENQLTQLDLSNLTNLNEITCVSNLITELDFTNNNAITSIICSGNLLTQINIHDNLNLNVLECSNNQIENINLNNLPNLQSLYFDNNLVENLLSSFPKLEYLTCINNHFTTLDLSQSPLLTNLICSDNTFLNSLFIKNSISEVVNFENCPNLQYICADENQIQDIQNQINTNGYTNCNVNSYCSFTPGGTFYTIQGNNRYDMDNNGCGATDINIPNFKIGITSTSATATDVIPNETGNYSLPLQEGTYTLTPTIENPSYFTISPTTVTVSLPDVENPFIQDFCITANGTHDDLEVSIIPINVARPGFDATYKLTYRNKGTNVQSGNLNFVFDDSVLDFVTATPMVTSQTLNNLNWDFVNLAPFESRAILFTFNVNSPMETPAVNSNDILAYTANIIGLTDETPTDNIATLNQRVVNSYDPNDKTCLEGDTITPSMVGKYVHYKIRFENTGTFPAQNIVVTDRIDTSKFDISTLEPTDSSHPFITKISDTNKVEFIFENINLPFDDAHNDGYVVFKIKTWATLGLGDELNNTANIYFDYNFPIETNTATTTVANPLANQDFEFSNYFRIYPNPVQNTLSIKSQETIVISSISIYNILGQVVQIVSNAKNTKIVDVSNLKTGNYFIKIVSDKGTSTSKFIKE